jgi:hypothetical protein
LGNEKIAALFHATASRGALKQLKFSHMDVK